MLERHEFPARETISVLVKSPLSSEHTVDAVRTDNLHLYIPSALVLNPDPDSNVLQPLKVGVVEHLLSDFERRLDTFSSDTRPGRLYQRRRVWLVLARGWGVVRRRVDLTGIKWVIG